MSIQVRRQRGPLYTSSITQNLRQTHTQNEVYKEEDLLIHIVTQNMAEESRVKAVVYEI
jgi:hypothetical protein